MEGKEQTRKRLTCGNLRVNGTDNIKRKSCIRPFFQPWIFRNNNYNQSKDPGYTQERRQVGWIPKIR